MNFELHPNLQKKDFIIDLPLCRVLLEDDRHYPWIFLVPRKSHIAKMIDLTEEDQLQLFQEMNIAQEILWETFDLDQLNVAAIGNKTPQLHVHVIGRSKQDPAWPQTIWDHPIRLPLTKEEKENRILLLQHSFNKKFKPL